MPCVSRVGKTPPHAVLLLFAGTAGARTYCSSHVSGYEHTVIGWQEPLTLFWINACQPTLASHLSRGRSAVHLHTHIQQPCPGRMNVGAAPCGDWTRSRRLHFINLWSRSLLSPHVTCCTACDGPPRCCLSGSRSPPRLPVLSQKLDQIPATITCPGGNNRAGARNANIHRALLGPFAPSSRPRIGRQTLGLNVPPSWPLNAVGSLQSQHGGRRHQGGGHMHTIAVVLLLFVPSCSTSTMTSEAGCPPPGARSLTDE